jgi:hypothetical protein
MAAKKFLRLVAGKVTEIVATVVSSGAPNDGDLVALDAAGKLDISVLPTGVGPDVKIIEASENIGAGKYVNIWDDTGTTKVRLADNSNSREAHGYLLTSVTSGNNATVYFEGANSGLSGLTGGQRQYLATAGGVTTTPPTSGGGAQISQLLGIAISATEINTDIDDVVVLA